MRIDVDIIIYIVSKKIASLRLGFFKFGTSNLIIHKIVKVWKKIS